MDPETVRTITTPAITAVSTLAGAAIVAYFGYRAQKHTQQQPLTVPAWTQPFQNRAGSDL